MARNRQCAPDLPPGVTDADIDGEPSEPCCCCGEPCNYPAGDEPQDDNGNVYCDECWEDPEDEYLEENDED